MREVLFWLKLLFVRSFDGIEKLIRYFDFSEDQSWIVVDMLEKKVKKFIDNYKPDLDELLVLLNALPKEDIDLLYCLRLKMALGELIGNVFIKELDSINSYDKCDERLQYVMDQTEGYIIRPHYFNVAMVKLNQLSDGAYRKIVDDFKEDLDNLIEDPQTWKMATAPISSNSKLS